MAKKNGSENAAPEKIEGVDMSQFSEEENLGFPPYWNPAAQAQFVATIVGFDDGDPEFERWVFQASHDIECHKGPKGEDGEDAEAVTVKKGGFFSTSNYVQFRLNQYIGLEVNIFVKEKVALAKGRTMWNMGMRVSPKTKALLTERRQAAVKGALPQGAGQTASS
jgi:hypothetical protein